MTTRCQNHWLGTFFSKTKISTGLPDEVDVAIIGGGIAGLALLYKLMLTTRLSAVLVDETGIGFHASGRCSGLIGNLTVSKISSLLEQYDDTAIKPYLEDIEANNTYIKRLISKERMDCDLSSDGQLHLSESKPMPLYGIVDSFAKAATEPLVKHAVGPDSKAEYGFYYPSGFSINPYKFIHSMALACGWQGNRNIVTCASVKKIDKKYKGYKRIHINHLGSFKAKHIVHCTGAYAAGLVKSLRDKFSVSKTTFISTTQLPDSTLESMSKVPLFIGGNASRIHKNTMIVSGCQQQDSDLYDAETLGYCVKQLEEWRSSVFPSLPKSVETECTWSIIECAPKDGLPIIGRLEDRDSEYVGIGYGIEYAFQAADILVAQILHQDMPQIPLFNPSRF